MSDLDKEELSKTGTWHNGVWKGKGSSKWRITSEAVQMMDDALIDGINSTVGKNDILYHLGDFAFARKYYYQVCREYRNRINCKNIIFIWGNHDEENIRDLFSETYTRYNLEIDQQLFVLDHYSLLVWDQSHRNSIMLHGHSHSAIEAWKDKYMPGHRSLDVGVDNAYKLLGQYRPFSIDEILEIMKTRTGYSMELDLNPEAPREKDLC